MEPHAHRSAIAFIGDLGDPWVVDIARALPAAQGIDQVDCPGDLAENLIDPRQPPRLIVVHRHRLSGVDLRRLREWRQPASSVADSPLLSGPPAVFLCVSPFVRYDELTRSSGLVDLVVSEADAALVVPRRAARLLGTREDRPARTSVPPYRIEVAGGNSALCETIAAACAAAGYDARRTDDLPGDDTPFSGDAKLLPAGDPESPAEAVLTIWEVPVLEPDWSQRLARRSVAAGPVIALIGFADRATVTQAKAAGAFACLDLPSRVDDLLDVIDRVTRS